MGARDDWKREDSQQLLTKNLIDEGIEAIWSGSRLYA